MYASPSTYVPPYKWNLLPYVIAHKTIQAWESVGPHAEPSEDLRNYFSVIDEWAMYPITVGSTKTKLLYFAPADIGYIVGNEYDSSQGFFNLVDVSDAVFAEGEYRDTQGNKMSLLHSYVNTARRVVTSDKYVCNIIGNVITRTGLYGPYSEINPATAYVTLGDGGAFTYPGVSITTMEGENNRIRQFSLAAPPVLLNEYTINKGEMNSGLVVPSPWDKYSGIIWPWNNYTYTMSPHPVGFSGSTPCVGYGQFFEDIPTGAVLCTQVLRGITDIGYKPPGYTLQSGETWNSSNQAWTSPDVSVLNDPDVVWGHPNAFTVQITAKDGMGRIYSQYELSQSDILYYFACFSVWMDGSNSPLEFSRMSLALILPPSWSGYVIPRYGDFISTALQSGSQTPPTSAIESQGSVRLDMNNCEDYEVHILEFSDGIFPARVPIYRAPEKLLNRTATTGTVLHSGISAPKVSPVVTGRVVTVDLPQPVKFFVSKIPFSHTQEVAYYYRGGNPIISDGAEEIPDGKIPDRFTGTVYVQVVDTYYCEMQEVTVNL